MQVVGIFGGNDVPHNVTDVADALGEQVAARADWICLTGGHRPCRPKVKHRAICAPHRLGRPWIGVTQAGPIGTERNGSGLVVRSSLGHKRNLLEAYMIDVAIVLAGGPGTASEAVATLCLGKPVVIVGDQGDSPLTPALARLRAGEALRPDDRVHLIETALARLRLSGPGPIDAVMADVMTPDALAGAEGRIHLQGDGDIPGVVGLLDAITATGVVGRWFPDLTGYEAVAAEFADFAA